MSLQNMTDRTQRPEVHDIPFLNAPATETVTLDNGVKVIILDRGVEPVCRLTFSWLGGKTESDNPAAIALLSQLFKEGSETIPPEEMADLLDTCGAWIVSELHPHNLSLTLFAINSTIGKVLPAIITLINAPVFPERETEALKARMNAQQSMVEKRVDYQAKLVEKDRIYGPSHPAAREMTSEEILAVTRDDIRAEYEKLYRHQPLVVYVAGHLDDATRATILDELSKLDTIPGKYPEKRLIPFSTSEADEQRRDCPDALQSAIRISMSSIPRSHPDYETLRAVVTALGGYFGSRLMTVIREEKGLTYGISAALLGHHEGSFITISSQCDNSYTRDVIDETMKEIHRLASEPMDAEELATLKRYASSNIISTFDTPFSAMDYFVTQRHSLTPPDYLERQQRAIAALTPEIIMEFASKYIDNAPKYISIAGATANSPEKSE